MIRLTTDRRRAEAITDAVIAATADLTRQLEKANGDLRTAARLISARTAERDAARARIAELEAARPGDPPMPDGLVGQYLTIGGATVDLFGETGMPQVALCTGFGCDFRDGISVCRSAQEHAATCRAIPKPTAVRP